MLKTRIRAVWSRTVNGARKLVSDVSVIALTDLGFSRAMRYMLRSMWPLSIATALSLSGLSTQYDPMRSVRGASFSSSDVHVSPNSSSG